MIQIDTKVIWAYVPLALSLFSLIISIFSVVVCLRLK
jgi:hypothetical protein